MTVKACRFLLVCVIACLVAACGLQKAPHTAGHAGQDSTRTAHSTEPRGHSSTPANSSPSQPAAAACTMRDITVRLDTRAAGVAAGTSYLPLDFTNSGQSRCLLAGFPEVAIAASRSGRQVGAAGTQDRSAAAQTMTLGAGQTAHIWLRLVQVANLPAGKCRPVQAAGLRIGLPGQNQVAFVPDAIMACRRTVRGTDVLTVEPFRPGIARAGTAQVAFARPAGTRSPGRGGRAQAAVVPCGSLRILTWLGLGDGGGTLAAMFYPVEVSNTTTQTCTLTGFPAAWAVSGTGVQVGLGATTAGTPHPVVLAPGRTAHATLAITPGRDVAGCKLRPRSYLQVELPGQQQGSTIPGLTITACANASVLRVGPVQAGTGLPGRAGPLASASKP